jgi:DNA-binding NarL/FixJ family response regulator
VLTGRQVEVIELLSLGPTGPQIAARLHVSPKTGDQRAMAIHAKLDAHSRAEAIRNYNK